MTTHPLLWVTDPDAEPQAGAALEHARGLAQLAFGSLTRATEYSQVRHLALLPAESLELDLGDPAQRHFGDYELLELLGEGGMGVVYRAHQASLDRDVAVKLLSAGPWATREFVARFEREAQNAARMQHPNIVTVYEVGNFEGLQFFSMRLVRGESLSAKLRRGEKFAPKAAAALMRTIAEAVGYAHGLGVLHLDLKPANVLLDETATPYVADFGLARRLENALTIENDEVSGTPAYMAPEQAQVRANKLTSATDIWGLGAILYQLLTGRPPFRADTAQDTVKLVLEGQIRAPRRWQPSLPMDLEAIVMRCLNRDPAERYASARALADDLARYVEGRPVQARPLNAMQRVARWAKREPKLAASIACAIAVLVIGLIATTTQWRRADTNANTARDNLWATRAETAQQALIKGDGFHSLRPLVANLAEMEAAGRSDAAAIERERIGTVLASSPQLIDLLPLPKGEQATSIAIAPDARHFVVATIKFDDRPVRHVRRYDLATLRETWSVVSDGRTFLSTGGDYGAEQAGLRYTADGRFVLVSVIEEPVVPAPRRSDMIAFDARDGKVVSPQGLSERQADIVYDDAAHIALVRFRSDLSRRWPDSGQFYKVDGWKPIGPLHASATSLAADLWLPAPGGKIWLGTRDSAQITLYDVPSLKPRWALHLPQTSLVRAWKFSHDGRHVALGSVDGVVRLVDAANGNAVALATAPAARVQWLEFSADDRTLAALDENGQFWTWDVATGASRSAPLHLLRNGVQVARIHFAGSTLFGGADSELAYVTLPPHAVFNNEAVPGAARLPGSRYVGVAFDVSQAARRLVTAGSANLLEIWRLPASPLLAAHAAPLESRRLTFDGTHVVGVDGATVRVTDVTTGAALSPPLRHPEPVRFAELSPDGKALVTIAGRTVRVIDPKTWKLRGVPIVLPQTPLRAIFAQAAPVLVVGTGEYAGNVLREHIQRIDLAKGALFGDGVHTDWLEQFEIDGQGRHALILTLNFERHTETGPLLIDLDSGAASCRPALQYVVNFALSGDARHAWFNVDSETGAKLRHWDLTACRELAVYDRKVPETASLGMLAGSDGSVVVHRASKDALLRIGADGRLTAAIGQYTAGSIYDFALSADGNRAAFATRNAVYLIDAQQGRRLSAPLAAPIAGDDGIAKLTFSPDGTRLLARTINGRWLLWELPRTGLDVATLTRLARVLDPIASDPLAPADLQALRVQLHDHDHTTPITAPSSGAAAARVFAAAADAGIDVRFVPLDLGPAINVPLIGSVWSEPHERADRPTLAPGLQRFLGVDYRVEGGVQLSAGGTATALGPELHHSAVVPVPGVAARRVHVLAFMHIPMNRKETSRPFGYVTLIGANRRETRLEIRTVRDVVTDLDPDLAAPRARVAFFSTPGLFARLGDQLGPDSAVYTVALDVPAATGPIHGLRFDVPDGPMEAPLFFGVTLETAPPAAIAKQP